jgi:hypothetical protein
MIDKCPFCNNILAGDDNGICTYFVLTCKNCNFCYYPNDEVDQFRVMRGGVYLYLCVNLKRARIGPTIDIELDRFNWESFPDAVDQIFQLYNESKLFL